MQFDIDSYIGYPWIIKIEVRFVLRSEKIFSQLRLEVRRWAIGNET